MAENESYSLDNVKLMVAGIALAAVCLTVIGLIPVGILLLGLIISIKGGDVKNITATTRLIQGLILAGALGLAGYAVERNSHANRAWAEMQYDPSQDPEYADVAPMDFYQVYMGGGEQIQKWNDYRTAVSGHDSAQSDFNRYADERNYIFAGAVGVAISAWFLGFLWLKPLQRRFERMRKAAEDFANREKKEKKAPQPPIIKREAFASFSTAEELKKWRELYTDGAISRDVYHDARDKILNGRT